MEHVVPQPCRTCGKQMAATWEWYEIVSLDGVPVWSVPDDFRGTPTHEAYYCRSCFHARMSEAPDPVPYSHRPLLTLPPAEFAAAMARLEVP